MNAPPHESSLSALIGGIAAGLSEAPTSELAELRRLTPEDPGGRAFWRIVVTRLEPRATEGPLQFEALSRWAVILRALAALQGLHDPRRPLGLVMAEAKVSELRVMRLLRSEGPPLWDALRGVTHQLASAALPLNLTELARLVLSAGRQDETSVRQKIANDYYAQLFRNEKEAR